MSPVVHAAEDALPAVLAEAFASPVTVEHLDDLTTGPQRPTATSPTSSVHPDAVAIAPASPADWTPLEKPVPGLRIHGTVKDQPQFRVLVRLPDDWNGKMVVAGASGTRSEFNGDLVISDLVLQRGYAYVSQNKGMDNATFTTADDPDACPALPVVDFPANNVFLRFSLLEKQNRMREWGKRMRQAANIGRDVTRAHYGRRPRFTYAMGVSNGGYQVRKAVEDFPDVFDGGVDWEGVLWREDRPNFIGELPVGLKNFPAYRASGFDPNSAAARAIRAANMPPDLVVDPAINLSLWALNRQAFWEVTECLYVKELDPAFNPGPGNFEAFSGYDPAQRRKQLRSELADLANSGHVTRPLISVHGTLDALIPLLGHARPYQELVRSRGLATNYRLYEVQNGNHLESFKARLPALELIQPHAQRAFTLLEDWVERRIPAPPSQCVARGGRIEATAREGRCDSLLVQ
jgi:hypothetical protein